MDYVTDTHSIVWYFTEDIHLSKKALDIFEGTIKEGTIIVPAVVLAEIMFISKKGKINLTFKETLNKIKEYENFELNGKPLLSYLFLPPCSILAITHNPHLKNPFCPCHSSLAISIVRA